MIDTLRCGIATAISGWFAGLEALENRVLLSAANASPPVISAFACDVPTTVSAAETKNGKSLTLWAQVEGQVNGVRFYSDTNNNGVLDAGDKRLGVGRRSSGAWSLTVAPPAIASGDTACRFFAQATGAGRISDPHSLEVVVPRASIGSFAGPASIGLNKAYTLTAVDVKSAASVGFYRDVNHNNVVDDGDTFLGAGVRLGKTWKLSGTATFSEGVTRLLVRAVDANGGFSQLWLREVNVVG